MALAESTEPSSAPTAGSVAVRNPLYDARRDVYYAKPVWRGWLHLLWFEASLVFGTLLLVAANGAVETTAVAIYAATVTGLFGTSALYHRGNWRPSWNRALQRLDHTMIFLLIAGTATPAFLLAGSRSFGLTCLVVMWTLTLAAITIHLFWMNAPERLVGATFIALGWAGCVAVAAVWTSRGPAPGVLLVVGGLLYTAGAIAYHRRRPDPWPTVFGYHEVFHACVCAAAACQYVAITLLII